MIYAQEAHIVGVMKSFMRKGELFATIDLDTLSNKPHLYGMGPVEFLTGEITVITGNHSSLLFNSMVKSRWKKPLK